MINTTIDELFPVFCETNNVPKPAQELLRVLIDNNVPFDNADDFCKEHFIIDTVAEYYRKFFMYVKESLDRKHNNNTSSKAIDIIGVITEEVGHIKQAIGNIEKVLQEYKADK